MRSTIVAFLLPLLASLTAAQGATVQFYGAGCSLNGQPLTIGATGLPQLGTTFTLTYSGPNMSSTLTVQPAIALGLGATMVPIPTTLLPNQPPGCSQWATAEVIAFMAPTPAGGFDDFLALAVPNDPMLIGFQFTAQWFAIAIQCGIVLPCNWTALPTSDAALMTVGL